jgi:hypothetical protein
MGRDREGGRERERRERRRGREGGRDGEGQTHTHTGKHFCGGIMGQIKKRGVKPGRKRTFLRREAAV